jgi:predicted metal-binding membrane protein
VLSALLRHDRTVVLAGLVAVIVLSWVWLLTGAGLKMDQMDMGGGQIMLMAPPWTVQYAAMIFLMWIIMMAAMMLPSAAPAILLVIALTKQRGGPHAKRASGEFAFGYVAVWGAFSLIATGLQWALDRAGLLSETMASGSVVLAALLLFAAGVYQLTPWKQACLRHCRSPLEFLTRYWRQDPLGPMRAGAWHGAFCLGCCWMLMGLLFVGGLMNLLWIAGLALLVLIEKLFPLGPRVSQLTGVGLIGWGLFVLVR